MFRKLLKPKPVEEPQETIDLLVLEEHLDSIKVCLLEIRGFRKKKIVKSPTFHFMQNIDLEEAWPSCRETLRKAFDSLCHVAENLQVEFEAMPPTAPFGKSLDQFVNLIDRITIFLEGSEESFLSTETLLNIDNAILRVQQAALALQKKVMVDFVFTRNSAI